MIYDCIIIGKGPAGISAGIYIKRAGFNVLIIGKDGGSLEKTEAIDNYYGFSKTISGKELLLEGISQAQRLGINIETDEVIGTQFTSVYEIKTRNNVFYSKTLIIATGTNRRTPNITGIKRFEGKGISYCAICDAFFYKNKNVSVLGSGDYALAEANELLPIARSVTILTNGEQLVENRSIRTDKIEIVEKPIKELRGQEKLEEIIFNDNTKIQTNGVFVAIGTASCIDIAKKLGAITNGNNIVVNENMATNIPGLFACGDCTGGLLQISKAVYEGSKAGIETINYIRKIAV